MRLGSEEETGSWVGKMLPHIHTHEATTPPACVMCCDVSWTPPLPTTHTYTHYMPFWSSALDHGYRWGLGSYQLWWLLAVALEASSLQRGQS
jgi:hypothetical protein